VCELGGDEIGIASRQALQNSFQFIFFNSEYLRGADTIGIDVVIQ
jgi:hypothetical protein